MVHLHGGRVCLLLTDFGTEFGGKEGNGTGCCLLLLGSLNISFLYLLAVRFLYRQINQ